MKDYNFKVFSKYPVYLLLIKIKPQGFGHMVVVADQDAAADGDIGKYTLQGLKYAVFAQIILFNYMTYVKMVVCRNQFCRHTILA